VRYKDVTRPPDAEPLGHRLGLSVLKAAKQVETSEEAELVLAGEILALPRATDMEQRIAAIRAERIALIESLRPTDINFKTFVPLYLGQRISPETPSYYGQGYLHEQAHDRTGLAQLDTRNRAGVDSYLKNIEAMEQLTRLNTNLKLLEMHLAQNRAAQSPTIDVEVTALRIGDFRMVTFPGELSVEVGLNIKAAAPARHTFVAGYTNGYIYYAPTAAQRLNSGYAQEDCDCLLAPEWQDAFEAKALELLKGL